MNDLLFDLFLYNLYVHHGIITRYVIIRFKK